MIRPLLLLLVILVLFPPRPSVAFDTESKLESWYTQWGLGYVNNTYPQDEETGDTLFKGSNHHSGVFDLFGFYAPINEYTIVGGIMNISANSWEKDDIEVGVANILIGPSILHFIQHEIGRGPFLRADVGIAWHSFWLESDTIDATEESDAGVGFLVGSGYAFPITPGNRILVTLNYASRIIEEDATNSLALTFSGLF